MQSLSTACRSIRYTLVRLARESFQIHISNYHYHSTINTSHMKHFATTCLAMLLLMSMGCSSSKESSSDVVDSPLAGSWAMEGGSSAMEIQFSPGGEATIAQGAVLTAINRFQNTDRAKYISRLVKTATYDYNGSDQLTLNVMADWTGKGTGARRAEDKSVASAIVFSVQEMGDTIKLTKLNMTQSGSGTDNTNASEELSFTLKKM